EGGMGVVWKATDTRLDRSVAIKVLRHQLSDDVRVRERFEREAHTISNLNHPHICTLHDIGHQDEIDFIVMEYLEGEVLAERLQRDARINRTTTTRETTRRVQSLPKTS
ncbi:MAG: protein kinase, partial [Gammaproteobacteria bacterium]|nr:protein kinase [Gammaproteobacteria bacterium]